MFDVPVLRKGKGCKGPEPFGCYNTGTAPTIFRSRVGKFVVGAELCCRDAMRIGVLLSDAKTFGHDNHRVYIYKTRDAAVAKFKGLCEKQSRENFQAFKEMNGLYNRARKGDIAAALQLG